MTQCVIYIPISRNNKCALEIIVHGKHIVEQVQHAIILLPWMTWELSFRKKLYKYLGMKADMQAYAKAVKDMI